MKKTLPAFMAALFLGMTLMLTTAPAQALSCRALAAKLGIKPKAMSAYIAKCKLGRAHGKGKRKHMKGKRKRK